MYYPQVQNNTNTRTMIDTFRGYNHNYRIENGEFYEMENLSSDGFPVMMPRKPRYSLVSAKYAITGMLYEGGNLAFLDGYIFHCSTWSLDLTKLVTGEATEIDSNTEPPSETKVERTWEDQTLLRYGAYILIYPLNIWVNVDADVKQAGIMAAKVSASQDATIKYSICDIEGADLDVKYVSEDEPTGAQTGDYWLNTLEGSEGLNMYYSNAWNPVATTYVKIEVPGVRLDDHFGEGDAVNLNNLLSINNVNYQCLYDLNNGSIIQRIGSTYDENGDFTGSYIVVIGLLDRAEPYEIGNVEGWRFTVERPIPLMDYVCVNENRVWGCRYGYNSKEKHTLVNEIYCSKLGDFKNWYVYQGLASDSYAVSVGEPGAWTGCISFQGNPIFFKEDMIFKMYGSFPSEFTLYKSEARGVQESSSKSLCIVGEYLYYKAPTGVMAYDGSSPVLISSNLGRDIYYFDGIAGAAGDKYYIEVTDKNMVHSLFVYDIQLGIWTKETSMKALCFANSRDGMLFATDGAYIYGIGRENSDIYATKIKSSVEDGLIDEETLKQQYIDSGMSEEDATKKAHEEYKKLQYDVYLANEEYVQWSATTGDMGYEYPDYKYVDKITVRAYVEHKAEIEVQISYDDGNFEDVGILRGFAEVKSQSLSIVPYRCDHFKLRLKGHGEVRIYSIALTLDTGSEEYEYNKN